MKKSTTIVVVAAACGLVFASIAIMTPKVVKAAVAILVRDQDNPARHPFLAHCDSGGTNFAENQCVLPAVPAGQELVIETVSIQMTADANKSVLLPTLRVISSKVDQYIHLNAFFDNGSFQPNGAISQGVLPVRFYADPGASIVCIVDTQGSNPSLGLFVNCTLSGYFVSLP